MSREGPVATHEKLSISFSFLNTSFFFLTGSLKELMRGPDEYLGAAV